mgnify:CR=1 FL=1
MGSLACPESPTAVPGVARVPGVPTAMPRVPHCRARGPHTGPTRRKGPSPDRDDENFVVIQLSQVWQLCPARLSYLYKESTKASTCAGISNCSQVKCIPRANAAWRILSWTVPSAILRCSHTRRSVFDVFRMHR